MANKRMKTLQLPGLSDVYTYVQADSTLTQSGEAADAKATGDALTELGKDVTELQRQQADYSVYNFVPARGEFTTVTRAGVTYSWNDAHTVCNLSGTTTGFSYDRVLWSTTDICGLTPGKSYFFNVVPTISTAYLGLYWYINGTLQTEIEITSPRWVAVPANATGILARVSVHTSTELLDGHSVRVEILNSPYMSEMQFAKNVWRYVSNNTITLGDITDPGYYVIGDSWTITDAPSGYTPNGAVLTVEHFAVYDSMYKQTLTATLAPNNKKVYTRMKLGAGTWYPWVDMTPLNRGTIVPTGDNTDRKAEIEATLSRDGVCILAPGEYYVSGIVMPDETMLKGSGIGATKLVMISGETGSCVKMGTRCSVSDLSLYGQDSDNYTTQGDRNGIGWVGTYESESSPGTYPEQGQVSDLYIEGFTGGGICCTQTSMQSRSGLQAVNVTIYKCWCGIYNPFVSEYCQFTNIRATNCYYGAYINGGNNIFANCSFTSCTCGLFMYDDGDTAKNNSHGSFIGCCFNHANNNDGIAISTSGIDNGEMFVGCQIFYGKVRIAWSKGVRFVGCNFGRNTDLTIQNSYAIGFDSCQFRTAEDSPLTKTSSTGVRFNGCLLYDGTEFNPDQS